MITPLMALLLTATGLSAPLSPQRATLPQHRSVVAAEYPRVVTRGIAASFRLQPVNPADDPNHADNRGKCYADWICNFSGDACERDTESGGGCKTYDKTDGTKGCRDCAP